MAAVELLSKQVPVNLEGWDPTRIRKGSRIIPFFLFVAMAVSFMVSQLQSGRAVLTNHFGEACANLRAAVEAATTAAPVQPAPSSQPAPAAQPSRAPSGSQAAAPKAQQERALKGLTVECAKAAEPRLTIEEIKRRLGAKTAVAIGEEFGSFRVEELGGTRRAVQAVAWSIKAYMDDVVKAFHQYSWSVMAAIAVAALYAVVPGFAGAIYRRAFGTWFVISFVILLAIKAVSANLGGGKSQDEADIVGVAGGMFVLIVMQALVLLLAHRLRRHSGTPGLLGSLLPEKLHNRLLSLGLWVLAIAMAFFGVGNWIWDYLPGSATFNKWNVILFGLPLVYTLFKVSRAWHHAEPKNIVICLDGTSNTPDQMEFGRQAHTNVFKLFRTLKASESPGSDPAFDANLVKRYGNKQIGLYYVGVGSTFESSSVGQVLGMATGLGASSIVDRAYLDLIKIYRPGDKIYIFGFSRGAAIARLLARAIHQRGAPRSAWTLRLFGRHWTVWQSRQAKPVGSVPIAVLGCWDTVGAFGLPKKLAGIDFQKIDLFKDLSVPDNVEQAYHLVAIDEQRDSFKPTLMEPDPLNEGRIVEVWFSGDHANVGGGWATAKLSDITLDFILRQVSSGYAPEYVAGDPSREPGSEAWGLCLSALNDRVFPPEHPARKTAITLDPDLLGQLRQWMSNLYEYAPRKLPLHAVISDTVFQRMTQSEPVYAPQSLFDLNEELDKKRSAVGNAVTQLKGTHSLKDDEYERVMMYKERLQLKRWTEHIRELTERGKAPVPAMSLATGT